MDMNAHTHVLTQVKKRDNSIVKFDLNRIQHAIAQAMKVAKEGSADAALQVAEVVTSKLLDIRKSHKSFIPNVEGIQDEVQNALMDGGFHKTATAYILYRNERALRRQKEIQIPDHVKQLTLESRKFFRNSLSEFVYLRTYARWIEDEKRRETWIETIDRYLGFMRAHIKNALNEQEYTELRNALLNQEIMPSMRLLQFAGNAANATHVCAYNCSFIAPRTLRDFGEVMYVSMCGTGVGFSVESQNIQALPQIALQTGEKLATHVVDDSKEGWCDAFILGLTTWHNGLDIQFDFSKCRPAGARLKTMGGKSSGPEPLKMLLDFSRAKIFSRQGRRLTNLDAHDILCKIGEIVVSGGVRRSAMISLSDLDDAAIRDAKKGQFYYTEPQRCIANNSAVYSHKPDATEFLDEWLALMKSGTGERGIFNRGSLISTLPERRIRNLSEDGYVHQGHITGSIGTNPCAEIILRSKQFCNLSEVVARQEDDEATLLRKIRLATILGTFQSTLSYFPYLSKEWKENCERERLLGVSITGQWDCAAAREPEVLEKLKAYSVKINREYAERFGISASTCVTCVKPSGTVSQTVDCASGMHPRYSQFYIRRIRISATDSLFRMLKEQGVPYHPEVGQAEETATTFVIDFPVKAPEGAVFKNDLTALDQLNHWKLVKKHYTEHNPSVTVSVSETEWIAVANWVYDNWELVGGLSFLPKDNHVYQLAPYEEINETQYHALCEQFKHADFSKLIAYELQDETETKRELACAGGVCEL